MANPPNLQLITETSVVYNAVCVCSQGTKTVWRFYLNLKHLSMKRETLSPPCTVLCEC